MKLLADPRLFNYLIILLFALASVRWMFAGNWLNATYWLTGSVINLVVTLGMK